MFYQEVKTARAAAMGTIMPWTGGISEIPAGWILCNGDTVEAKTYPLLVQAIGDTYNAGASDLSGSFPAYTGNIVLPNLNGKALMDLETPYFASKAGGGTGRPADTSGEAYNIINPLIGTNTDNSIPTIFNDVTTDVIFSLNDRTGYGGNIKGATIVPGEDSETIRIGPRKLGRNHLRGHKHGGTYETIASDPATRPGEGVIPYGPVNLEFGFNIVDEEAGSGGDRYYAIFARGGGNSRNSNTGFGGGRAGRTVAGVVSENPPINLFPNDVARTPLSRTLQDPRITSGRQIPYGLGGGGLTTPAGYINYYPDIPSTNPVNYGTLVSNPSYDFNVNVGTAGISGSVIEPHDHEEIEIAFSTGNLKPRSTLLASANIPLATTLDNAANRSVLQINFNTSQPGMSCIYIIRAY